MKRVKASFVALGMVLLMSAQGAGCLGRGRHAAGPARLEIDSGGVIRFEGAPVGINDLGARLHQAGVPRSNTVQIRFEDEASRIMIERLARVLALEGYRKVLFLSGPKATATAGP